jgi:hypothetical protein
MASVSDRTPPTMPSPGPPPRPRKLLGSDTRQQLEYADRTPEALGPDIATALTTMAGDGWRLVTFDGQRYIFERPRQDGLELHER